MATALAVLAGLSLALTLWRWLASRNFPLHQPPPPMDGSPPALTLLKPLKGIDASTRECLRSWLAQDYLGPIQVLFGVPADDDPASLIVRELMAEFPRLDISLVVCRQRCAINAKVSTLMQIEPLARHEFIVISDADVSVPPGLLRHLVATLTRPGIALANCFYRLPRQSTVAGWWEAVAVNADFWSEVLQARSLMKVDFALGAVMALSRAQLKDIGGFAPLGGYLADDYQLGRRVFGRGGRIALSPIVVDCHDPVRGWKEAWRHQLRWARTLRASKPAPVFFSLLANATLWPVLWGFCGGHAALGAGVCLLFRIGTAMDQQRRLLQSRFDFYHAWLIPVKDLLGAVIWAQSFLGNRIEWRGEKYRVQREGRLVSDNDSPVVQVQAFLPARPKNVPAGLPVAAEMKAAPGNLRIK